MLQRLKFSLKLSGFLNYISISRSNSNGTYRHGNILDSKQQIYSICSFGSKNDLSKKNAASYFLPICILFTTEKCSFETRSKNDKWPL